MRVAICYFGLLRNVRTTFETHDLFIFKQLEEAGIEFDVFLHTWEGSLTSRRGNCHDMYYKIDTQDYKLFNPLRIAIDNQDDFIQTLNFEDYFKKDIFDKYGESRQTEWFPDLILFHLCSIESQRRVINMVKEEKNTYSKIIVLRPDILFYTPLSIKCIEDTTPKTVYIPNYDSGEGCNDRFAVFNFNEIDPYANRIHKIKEFRNSLGRIVGEKYLKYVLDSNKFTIKDLSMQTDLARDCLRKNAS